MAIGILGGTFDPIHLGHIHLANEALKKAHLTRVHVIPCSQSPLRTPPKATNDQRLEMAKLGILGNQNLFLDAQEIKRKGISYTIDTLRNIHSSPKNKHQTLALIMGIDAFNSFDHWHEWKNILELAHLIIANRKNIKIALKNWAANLLNEREIKDPLHLTSVTNGKILILDINPLPISATEVRHFIETGNFEEAQKLLPPKVWQYILKNKIYSAH